jgi:hypothetical protein
MASRWQIAMLFCLSVCVTCSSLAQSGDQQGIEHFESKIRPVLVGNCYKCHSATAKKVKGGLLLDTRDGIRKGGENGAAVVPGNLKKSLLISALKHDDFEMPPDKKLSDKVVADFEQWINLGAPDPRDGKSVEVVQKTIDIEKGREFWSFQPVKKQAAPKVKETSWPRSEIDRFVLAKLESIKLKPVADAKSQTLVRRLYFDLVGLPPTPEALADFSRRATGNPQKAIEELVDELLDSPQFGERWGRHWLDVARYAESNGNTRNATFPHAWRYRDYVIDAVNDDTPYDRFIMEQIAGDLLPDDSAEQRNRNLTATGFLALGSKPVIRGKKAGGFIPDIASDQIEVTTRAMLGLTVACARCHDHKFDPIPTTDYYALAGIFASSETLYGGGGNSMGGAPATALHELAGKDANKAKAHSQWKSSVAKLKKEQAELNKQIKKLRPRKNKKSNEATAKDSKSQDRLKELAGKFQMITADLKKLQNNPVSPPGLAMGIRDAAKVSTVPVYVRGESAKGTPVPRGFVSVAVEGGAPELPSNQSGRLELARWMASPGNPLTARVVVNRIWLHLFGEGIVRTPDNFGLNGDRASHPELLDWLAAMFVEDGWSTKKMIRRIVLTRTYALSSAHSAQNYEVDPDNVYVWRHARRRLEAEAIRDAILAASGQLDLQRPAGSVVTRHGGKLIQDGLTPETIHQPSSHRSAYLPMLRNGLPEMLEIFDVADPSLVVGRRSVTTVPAQDLYLMNSPFVVQQSRQFADELLESLTDESARIETAYLRALSRPPTTEERVRAAKFLKQSTDALGNASTGDKEPEAAAWASFCQALIVSAEFRHTN